MIHARAEVFDDAPCLLGEGPLWHPGRAELFWFDILGKRLFARGANGRRREWQFNEHVSAAGRIDDTHMLVAGETALLRFSAETGAHEPLCPLEADNPATRANDGRADPWGGFWIGTMGKRAETGAGAIYRYYRGELRKLFAPWTVPNSICFTPDRRFAYLADSPVGIVWRQALAERDGWPEGDAEIFLELPAEHYRPDGAVVDAAGNFWCAQVGHGRLTCHAPDGSELHSMPMPARRVTCPAFGGARLTDLFVTSAREKLNEPGPGDGLTYRMEVGVEGQAEHVVVI